MSNLRTIKLVVFTTLHNPGIDVSIIVTIKYNSYISVHIHVIVKTLQNTVVSLHRIV